MQQDVRKTTVLTMTANGYDFGPRDFLGFIDAAELGQLDNATISVRVVSQTDGTSRKLSLIIFPSEGKPSDLACIETVTEPSDIVDRRVEILITRPANDAGSATTDSTSRRMVRVIYTKPLLAMLPATVEEYRRTYDLEFADNGFWLYANDDQTLQAKALHVAVKIAHLFHWAIVNYETQFIWE